jgi:hypothetical protein
VFQEAECAKASAEYGSAVIGSTPFATIKIIKIIWITSITCDVKSHPLLCHLERGSETRCSLNDSLSMQAKLVTAWFEAIGTMKPFAREGRTAR